MPTFLHKITTLLEKISLSQTINFLRTSVRPCRVYSQIPRQHSNTENITIDTAPSLEMIINELASDEFLTFYIALKK